VGPRDYFEVTTSGFAITCLIIVDFTDSTVSANITVTKCTDKKKIDYLHIQIFQGKT
jgi:hypothetical protein